MRRGFTLVELIVVIGMIAVLMASIGAGVRKAQLASQMKRAEGEANEMTNAIRAYENYVDDGIPVKPDWTDADESSLSFILGSGTDRAGHAVPVLYNAKVVGNKIRDPWGTPYQFRVAEMDAGVAGDEVARNMTTGVIVPNRYGRCVGRTK